MWRPLPRIALSLGALATVLGAATVPLALAAHENAGSKISTALLTLPFASVGALVAYRQPRNLVGWILLLLAVITTLGVCAGSYSVLAYRADGHGLLLSRLAVALAPGWIAAVLLLPLPMLLFPEGRVPSDGWRWTLWAYLALAGVFLTAVATTDARAFTDRHISVDSSGELASMGGSATGTAATVQVVTFLGLAVIGLVWGVRLVIRRRRATATRASS